MWRCCYQARADSAIGVGCHEIAAIVKEAVTGAGAQSMRDMGAVMKVVMPKVKGKADGKRVNQIVRDALQS